MPTSIFKIFRPDEQKLKFLAQQLMDGYLNLSDERRNWKTIDFLIKYHFHPETKNIFYEAGDFGAILGFVDIIPGHKCKLSMKVWDKKPWGKKSVREARELIKTTMKKFRLKRLEAETPDERVVKMAKMVGFEIEGTKVLNFRWNGEFFPTYIMSIINE